MATIALDPLIAQARRRARRRRAALALVVAAGGAAVGVALAQWGGGSAAQRPATSPQHSIAWAAAHAPVGAAGRDSSRLGWAMNGLGLWLTADGGVHWRTITPLVPGGDVVARVTSVQFVDAQHGWASGVDLIGRVVHNGSDRFSMIEWTSDGGRTWHTTAHECPACGGSLSFLDVQRGFALSANGLYRTANGGRTWWYVSSPGFIGPITFVDARHGWAATWSGGIYVTRDGGRVWRRVFGARAAQPVVLDAAHVVVPLGNSLAATSDGGRTWIRRRLPSTQVFSASSPTDFVAWSRGAFWTTRDGGVHWSRIPPTVQPDNVWNLQFTSRDDGWAIFGLHKGPVLVHTRDGGRNWSALTPR